MKLYRTSKGIVIEEKSKYHLINEEWHLFINDDQLSVKCKSLCTPNNQVDSGEQIIKEHLLKPIDKQEIWASGVTYFNSKLGRQEESKDAGGGDFYERVYLADRPELFFKSTAERAVGHDEKIAIRKDSTWNVPEPELTLVITASGKIVGYTIGNDMSSRSIEGENPLYLPQAKTYDRSAAIGPCILVTDDPLPKGETIHLHISRNGKCVCQDKIGVDQIVRKFEDLVHYLYLETSFPHGSFLMTGTGIVPDSSFTLASDDVIDITIDSIGTLTNIVA